MRKLLLRIPFFRFCALEHLKSIRRKQEEARQLHIDSVIMLIGQSAMAWAGIERMLDELIAFYQHVRTDLSRDHPRGLSSKLKYLRIMQCDPLHNPKLKEFLRYTRIEAKRLGDRRHELIHGLFWRRPVLGGRWESQRVVYSGPFARLHATTHSDEDFRGLLRDITAFGTYLSPKVWVITRGHTRNFPVGNLEEAAGELGLAD
jgi:hypothetical protein